MPLQRPVASNMPGSTPAATPEIPPFADCPRSQYATGHQDWYMISGPQQFPNFDICPTCFDTSIKPTAYARFFSRSPPKPETMATQCDFSNLWVHIAWVWLFSQSAPDVSLLGMITAIQVPEGPCPNSQAEQAGEKPTATRRWFCLPNPRTGALIEDLTICSHCVAHIETILPPMRGVFGAAAGGASCPATCDLMVPNSQRSLSYIDQIVEVAEKTLKTGYLDLTPAAEYIEKYALLPECPKNNTVKNVGCYSMPSSVPEFTVCQECYTEVILSEVQNEAPLAKLAKQVSTAPSIPPDGFSCQLYSPRTRQFWQDSLTTGDAGLLRQKVTERKQKQMELTQKADQLTLTYHQQKMQAKYHNEMMLIEANTAMHSALTWRATTGVIRPVSLHTLVDCLEMCS